MGKKDAVKIGCWAAFWGDTEKAMDQILSVPDIDYIVSDYLAEITMALLSRARIKDPQSGFVPDALTTLVRVLPQIARRGIKVVTNAGALNPESFAQALRTAAQDLGLSLRIAAVLGDNLLDRADEVRAACPQDIYTGRDVPERVSAVNAYLGAGPIAAALAMGADIVVTGRCVDSAVVLGPLIHEFGWSATDYDLLSAGTLTGHIVECGPQCTGGNHTDWDAVPGWSDMGYPVAVCRADGSAIITKPEGTGGKVDRGTVAEQLLYEIGDPGAYIMPDVVCDWRGVRVEDIGPDQVLLSGARGSAPTTSYKVTTTDAAGYRVLTTAMFAGLDAAGRARRAGEALLARTARLSEEAGFGPLAEGSVEVIGAGDLGPRDAAFAASEVVLKVGAKAASKETLEILSREFIPLGLVAQGMTGIFAGRPRVAPVFRVLHQLVDKAAVPVFVNLDGERHEIAIPPGDASANAGTPTLAAPDHAPRGGNNRTVPLKSIAFARSGDKGNRANIGVIARAPEFLDIIVRQVTEERIRGVFGRFLGERSTVSRWLMPGPVAINILIDEVLGGEGGTSSLRYDPQAKSFAAMLLSMPVEIPDAWDADGRLTTLGRLA